MFYIAYWNPISSVCFMCTSVGDVIAGEQRVQWARGDRSQMSQKKQSFLNYFLHVHMSIASYNTRLLRRNYILSIGEEAGMASVGNADQALI
jgi:hypothetical protein